MNSIERWIVMTVAFGFRPEERNGMVCSLRACPVQMSGRSVWGTFLKGTRHATLGLETDRSIAVVVYC
jgi:hypothetical protein